MDGRRLLIKEGAYSIYIIFSLLTTITIGSDFTGRPAVVASTGDEDASGSPSKSSQGLTKTAQKILSSQKQPPGQTLFLGNLGFETTEAAIKEMLNAHRPKGKAPAKKAEDGDEGDGSEKTGEKEAGIGIRKVRMGTFEDTGLCKG